MKPTPVPGSGGSGLNVSEVRILRAHVAMAQMTRTTTIASTYAVLTVCRELCSVLPSQCHSSRRPAQQVHRCPLPIDDGAKALGGSGMTVPSTTSEPRHPTQDTESQETRNTAKGLEAVELEAEL